MRTVGLGIQEFVKIIERGLFYVDKTDFISQWYKKGDDLTLITRPRRFGKTLTLDMLNCFFSTSCSGRQDLFVDLKIGQDTAMMQLQGTVPVINLSFSGVKGKTFDHFLISLAGRIAEVLYQYRYLLGEEALDESDREILRE